MGVETVVETDERICLRVRMPALKLRPEERPRNCGNCYKCEPDPIKNPDCSGNPKNYKENKNESPEIYFG